MNPPFYRSYFCITHKFRQQIVLASSLASHTVLGTYDAFNKFPWDQNAERQFSQCASMVRMLWDTWSWLTMIWDMDRWNIVGQEPKFSWTFFNNTCSTPGDGYQTQGQASVLPLNHNPSPLLTFYLEMRFYCTAEIGVGPTLQPRQALNL